MGDAEGSGTVQGGLNALFGPLVSPPPAHKSNLGIVLKYCLLQGTLQKMHCQEEAFIPRRVFLFRHVIRRSSA
jgi:hypothetical protein